MNEQREAMRPLTRIIVVLSILLALALITIGALVVLIYGLTVGGAD